MCTDSDVMGVDIKGILVAVSCLLAYVHLTLYIVSSFLCKQPIVEARTSSYSCA